jgi:hypothetical protein
MRYLSLTLVSAVIIVALDCLDRAAASITPNLEKRSTEYEDHARSERRPD